MPEGIHGTNPFDTAAVDTASVEHQASPTPVTQEKPRLGSNNPFAALIAKEASRTPTQDSTPLRLNDNSKLGAFMQGRSGVMGAAQHAANEGSKIAGKADDIQDSKMKEMMDFSAKNAERQMQLKMFESVLDLQKQLTGMVAKQSEKIQ